MADLLKAWSVAATVPLGSFAAFDPLKGAAPGHAPAETADLINRARTLLKGYSRAEIRALHESAEAQISRARFQGRFDQSQAATGPRTIYNHLPTALKWLREHGPLPDATAKTAPRWSTVYAVFVLALAG